MEIGKRARRTLDPREKNMINTEYLNWVHRKKMKNVHRDENSPVEMIEGKLKRLHTNGIDGRKKLELRE